MSKFQLCSYVFKWNITPYVFVFAGRFEVEDWPPVKEDLKNEALWDKSWEDDSVNDPIGTQLREALPKVQQQQQQEKQQQGQK